MKKILIPVLASVLILGSLGFSQDVFAPPPQKPEKIKINSVSWDTESQSFVIEFLANDGIAQAAQNAGFILDTKLNGNYDGGKIDFEASLTIMSDFEYSKGEVGTTFSSKTSCEPSCNEIQGFVVDVEVNAQILNPAGKPVAVAEPKTFQVDITVPGKFVELIVTDLAGNPLVEHECGVITIAPNPIFITGFSDENGKILLEIPSEYDAITGIFCPITPEYCPFHRDLVPPFVLPEGISSFDIQRTLRGGPSGCPF